MRSACVITVKKKKHDEANAVNASHMPATRVKVRDRDGDIPSENRGVQIL